jgi:hypothetical protein
MSVLAMVPSHMVAASASVTDAAAAARKADGSDALATLAAALPGTTTAEIMPDLGEAWTTGVQGWSADAKAFADSVDGARRDGSATDSAAGGLLDVLGSLIGRG